MTAVVAVFDVGKTNAKLLALTQVGGEGHDLGVIFGLEPLQDDRGVQPARIGKDDFFRRVGHAVNPSAKFPGE